MRIARPLKEVGSTSLCSFDIASRPRPSSLPAIRTASSLRQRHFCTSPLSLSLGHPDRPCSHALPRFDLERPGRAIHRQQRRSASSGWGAFASRRLDTSADQPSFATVEDRERAAFRKQPVRSQDRGAPQQPHSEPPAPANSFRIRRHGVNSGRTLHDTGAREDEGNFAARRRVPRERVATLGVDRTALGADKSQASRGDDAWPHLRRRPADIPRQDGVTWHSIKIERPGHDTADERVNEMQDRQLRSKGARHTSLSSVGTDSNGFNDKIEPAVGRNPQTSETVISTSEGKAAVDAIESSMRPHDRRERRRLLLEEQSRKYEATAATQPAEPTFAEISRQQMRMSSARKGARSSNRDDDDDDGPDIDFDNIDREKRLRKNERKRETGPRTTPTSIALPDFISVQSLATALKVRPEEFLEKLEELGFEDAAMDHVLSAENAGLVAMEYNFEPVTLRPDSDDLLPRPPAEDKSILPSRPPVVTIMGHVDHGKTTLLDFMRRSSVAATEHGGITQHIGAFSVPMASGKTITFLDTPGHAAFLSMRQRGANVTDIVVLVVAADDSVMPQTIEAIKHAKAAKVPIIVAMNKVDKDSADVERVKQDLLRHEIEVEDYGGDIQAVPVSGKTGQGIDALIEAMDSQAEVLDLRAETDGLAEGWILEAEVKQAGRVATVLVRRGTMRPGDIIIAGSTWARIRTLRNEAGLTIDAAGPGTPVEIDGWREQPVAGDEVLQAPSEERAQTALSYRQERTERMQAAVDMEAININRKVEADRREREKAVAAAAEAAAKKSNDGIKPHIAAEEARVAFRRAEDAASADEHKTLYFIIRADVTGSAEAIAGVLEALPISNQPIRLSILRAAVGQLSESDVALIGAVPEGQGFLVNFGQPVPQHIAQMAERAGQKIIDDSIIYRITDNVREIIEDQLPPVVRRSVAGEIEIAQFFSIKVGKKSLKVAGCKVRNGVVTRNKKVRVFRGSVGRDSDVVFDGMLSSLRNQKKDVQEMRKGAECGLSFEGWEDFEIGDVVQSYDETFEKRRLTA